MRYCFTKPLSLSGRVVSVCCLRLASVRRARGHDAPPNQDNHCEISQYKDCHVRPITILRDVTQVDKVDVNMYAVPAQTAWTQQPRLAQSSPARSSRRVNADRGTSRRSHWNPTRAVSCSCAPSLHWAQGIIPARPLPSSA